MNSALSGSGRVNGKIENHGGIIAVSGGEQLTLDSVLQNGTMEIEQSTQSRIVVNGAYTGNHGITGGGELLILGELSPGLSLAQIPMDGNLALGTSAVTRIEIGGTGPLEYDAVSASGMIRLEGHLDVKMVDVGHGIYQPSFGDTFQILTAMQGFDGTRFTSSSLPELDPNGSLVWQIEQGIGTFELQVGSRADFDGNGSLGCSDVDSLVMRIAAGIHQSHFDLTGDGLVTHADLTQWLSDAGSIRLASGNSFLVGDANLDGVVDGSDFNIWNSAKFTQTAAWCSGDFNADGGVDGSDFALWNSTKFTSADSGSRTQIVPEPSLCRLIGLAFFVLGSSCRNTAFRLRTKN